MMSDQPEALSLHMLSSFEIRFVRILMAQFFCTLGILAVGGGAPTSEGTELLPEWTTQRLGTIKTGAYQRHWIVF